MIDGVLALRALGLGDLLTALPALRALRDSTAPSPLVLAAPAWLAPLAIHAGAADRVLPTEALRPLHARRPRLAVNLHGRGPQSHGLLLATRPGRLVAFHHAEVPETAGSSRWRPDEHEVHRWCRLLAESGIPADPTRLHLDPAGLPRSPNPGATIVHPGASCAERRWPAERWSAVARHARRDARVIVTAGPGELELASRVAATAGLGPDSVWTGSVLDLAGLVAGADRVLSGDTGVAHLATALRRPSVVLFGPVAPAAWGPPPLPRHRVLWAGPDGLLEIGTTEVIGALRGLDARAGG